MLIKKDSILLIFISAILSICFIGCQDGYDTGFDIVQTPGEEIFSTDVKNLRAPAGARIEANTTKIDLGESVRLTNVSTETRPHLRVLSHEWRDYRNNVLSTDVSFVYTPDRVGVHQIRLIVVYRNTLNPNFPDPITRTDTEYISVAGEGGILLEVFKTGQTMCYDYDTHQEEPCTEEHRGQDGYYQSGVAKEYSRSGSIVTESVTGYMWMDNSDAKNRRMTWLEANSYCQNLTLNGVTGWRLPSWDELDSLIDYGSFYPIVNGIFQNAASYYYWSDSFGDTGSTGGLFMGYDAKGDIPGAHLTNVRCIR